MTYGHSLYILMFTLQFVPHLIVLWQYLVRFKFCQNYKNYNKISKQSWINICLIWQGFSRLPTISNRAVLSSWWSALLCSDRGKRADDVYNVAVGLYVSRSCLMSKYGGGHSPTVHHDGARTKSYNSIIKLHKTFNS